MLIGICKESDACMILKNLCLSLNNTVFVRGISFLYPKLTMKVHFKSTKEKTIEKIIKLLKELEEEKCIVYCPTV